jgi:capsular polysaccharide transport system permease protein
LSDKALADGVRYAEADLAEAESRLRGVREALGAFRQTYRVIDPATDVQGQAGVLGALEAELAEAEIARELLRGFAPDGDHRAVQADRRIAAISARISAARAAEGETAGTEIAPELIGRYEALRTDLGFAEAAYTQALGQLAVARADARRQARYLAAHIAPTLAERALYPRKSLILLTGGVALTLAWAVTAVIVRNIREGR